MSSIYQEDGTLLLDRPVDLPEVLDILIVGGGPAGTATAFRAKELGLNALVIDFDDLLKRIRDYPKDKLILPSFGGGDKMKFPAGGECVSHLYFDPIDKDDICATWKRYYRKLGVPARIGVELTGLERQPDGTYRAVTWNHRSLEQQVYRAKHVVLGLGRGVPRRFDIPGSTDGVAYRLDDPERYLEGPVCVIGGGTSAAEAVIAISRVKMEADEACPVYWSYRGSKMPRVSKALSDEFFEAYVGNGNIRYHPHSEPVAVVRDPDRNELLSIRVDRKSPEGRPQETVHLEFPKERCVACIGEDIPEKFLGELGVQMVDAGAPGKPKKMMAVTPLLETQQPNVYMVGDLLSQSYLETDDFGAPVDSFRKVKHRGNIKSSLRDGVFVAEVIQQRLQGRQNVEVVIRDADTEARPVEPEVFGAAGLETEERDAVVTPEEEAPLQTAFLSRVTPAGVEAEEYDLRSDRVTTIGRTGCDVTFPEDTLLSEDHASISHRAGDYFLRDDGSRAGTYLKVRPGHAARVGEGALLRAGRQILVVRRGDDGLFVAQYDGQGRPVGRHWLRDGKTTVFGRSGGKRAPDVVLDEQDRVLSRFHFSATPKEGGVEIEDFNSRNGTFLKIDGERLLTHGDVFRVGNQTFEVRLREDLPQKTGSMPAFVPPETEEERARLESAATRAVPEPAPATPTAEPAPAAAPSAGPSITFSGQDISGSIGPDETILEWADENEVELDYECWIGMCGCDAIRIVEGGEHLSEVDPKEKKTLERRGLEAGPCRLACMTKCSGPVVVEVVD
ncbi:MAG: FHA domain-containing protein [Gemmatimonadota bacterium]|jgi:thioredoxin reductase/pSer/pThr/pTyr-binding forkhead associated (FHA) protein/ferredoxin